MPPVRLEPATPSFAVKQSTTEPPHFSILTCVGVGNSNDSKAIM